MRRSDCKMSLYQFLDAGEIWQTHFGDTRWSSLSLFVLSNFESDLFVVILGHYASDKVKDAYDSAGDVKNSAKDAVQTAKKHGI